MGKEFTAILCEGQSDVAFISLYLINKCGFQFSIKPERQISVDINKGEYAAWYKKDNALLFIGAVGGCDNFNNYYSSYIKEFFNDQELTLSKIIVIKDADNNIKVAESSIDFENVVFKKDSWLHGTYETAFGIKIMYKSYLKIIPSKSTGALESIIIDYFLNDESAIAQSAVGYIDGLNSDEKKYLDKERFILKAKLGVIFTLIDPQKTFSSLSSKFSLVDLDNESIESNFGFLIDALD